LVRQFAICLTNGDVQPLSVPTGTGMVFEEAYCLQ
jgi:hypothetical protein